MKNVNPIYLVLLKLNGSQIDTVQLDQITTIKQRNKSNELTTNNMTWEQKAKIPLIHSWYQ